MPKQKPTDAPAPAERTVATVDRELAEWRAEADAARAEIAGARDRRQAALLTASVKEIAALDAQAALAPARLDKAEAFIANLGHERGALVAAADRAGRQANADRVAELVREARSLLEEEYAAAARAVVPILDRLAAIEGEVQRLSPHLPEGQALYRPETLRPQAFRGWSSRTKVVDAQRNPAPSYPPSLLAAVKLPGLIFDDPHFWPKPKGVPTR